MISIVIPAFRHAHYIPQTISSVLSRSVPGMELIIINDGSPDKTADAVAPFLADSRITYLEQENQGQAAARNRGLALARGKYIKFLDDDDLLPDGALEKAILHLESYPDLAGVIGGVQYIDEHGHPIGSLQSGSGVVTLEDVLTARYPMASPGQALFRTSEIREIGGFDPLLRNVDDFDLMCRLVVSRRVVFMDHLALNYRWHPSNASKDRSVMHQNALQIISRYGNRVIPARRRKVLMKAYTNLECNYVIPKFFETGPEPLSLSYLLRNLLRYVGSSDRRLYWSPGWWKCLSYGFAYSLRDRILKKGHFADNAPHHRARRVAIVSILEPERYGIARYPLEEASFLQGEGWEVEQYGLTRESEGDRNFDLGNLRDALAFLAFVLCHRWEKVSFHFYHGFVFPYLGEMGSLGKLANRLFQCLGVFLLGMMNRDSAVVIHEIPLDEQIAGFRRQLFGLSLCGFKRIEVFTSAVRERLIRTYPMLSPERVVVVDHGRHMQLLFHGSREEARKRLGVEETGRLFLCIGFWSPSKGFDRAIRAMCRAVAPAGTLRIVGSLNGSSEELIRHRELLRDLAAKSPAVVLDERFVSDKEFDVWIKAADAVLLPYRSILNSSVGARAVAAGTELWISDLPELASQFSGANIFRDEEELMRIFSVAGK